MHSSVTCCATFGTRHAALIPVTRMLDSRIGGLAWVMVPYGTDHVRLT